MALAAVLRRATPEDVPALVQLERESFTVPNWPAHTFLQYECLVAEIEGQLAAFLVSRQIYSPTADAPSEREILNLAVAPPFRRCGLATLLLKHELANKAVFFLEVRESNLPARALYESLGFVEISRRKDYYDHPSETAIVMQMK